MGRQREKGKKRPADGYLWLLHSCSDLCSGWTGALAGLKQAPLDYDACKAKGYARVKKGRRRALLAAGGGAALLPRERR